MKKSKLFVLSVLMLALLLFSFTLAGCFYDGDLTEDGSMFVGYSKMRKKAFVGMLCGDLGNTEFVLPDEYMGYPVTTLGGYIGRGYPCPFNFDIALPEEYRIYEENQRVFSTRNSVFDEVEDGWETVIFKIALGKNIREIEYTMPCNYIGIDIDNGDGTETGDILYKIVPYFTVPEENKTFYAEGGRLYYKSSGEPAGEFEYE